MNLNEGQTTNKRKNVLFSFKLFPYDFVKWTGAIPTLIALRPKAYYLTVTLLWIKDDVNDSVKKASEIDNEKCIALLKQYKELLETNAISKEDYEKIKNDILNKKEN